MGLYVWSYDYPSTCEAILSDIGKSIPYLMQQITANMDQMHISLDVLFLFWAKNSMMQALDARWKAGIIKKQNYEFPSLFG